jgi:hypothetical protein
MTDVLVAGEPITREGLVRQLCRQVGGREQIARVDEVLEFDISTGLPQDLAEPLAKVLRQVLPGPVTVVSR